MTFTNNSGNGNGGNGPEYVSIGSVDKPWGEVIPDTYWETEHLLGREVEITIVDILLEQYPDSPPRPVLKGREDPRLLRLRRDLRTTLKEFFGGTPAACIGKVIRLTAGQNQMKQIVIKILPAVQRMAMSPQQQYHHNQNVGPIYQPQQGIFQGTPVVPWTAPNQMQQTYPQQQVYQPPQQPAPQYLPPGPQILQNAYPGQGRQQPETVGSYTPEDVQRFLHERASQGGQPNPPPGQQSPISP